MQFVFEKENVFYKEKCNTTAIHDRCLANCFKEDSNNTTTLMSGKFTFDETLKCSGLVLKKPSKSVSKTAINPSFVKRRRVTTI